VEGNVVERSAEGIRVGEGCRNVVLRRNRFVECVREVVEVGALKRKWREAVRKLAQEGLPLVHWGFEEIVLGRRLPASTPLSGLDFSALVYGGWRLVQGVKGKALWLDGSSYAVAAQGEEERMALNLKDFTITAWIRPETVKGRRGIVAKRLGNSPSPFVVCLFDGRLSFDASDSQWKWSYNCSTPEAVGAGRWHHVAVVVEEGRRVVLYVDGRALCTHVVSFPLCENEEPVAIGRDAWGGEPPRGDTPGMFLGAIDEISIWPLALPEERIRAEAERGGAGGT